MSIEFYWVAVVATTVLSVARGSRLLIIDKWPPIKKLRDRYEAKTDGSDWQWLALCPFCMAPWVAVVVMVWGYLAGVYGPGDQPPSSGLGFVLWWALNGWFAISYLAGSYVARDGSGAEGV